VDEPIEEKYFNWLCHKVAAVDVPTPSLTYFKLLRDLHSIEFVWSVIGDDNRAQDGLDVRREFIRHPSIGHDERWMYMPCSVLEMLIAFSRRTEFATETSARQWFWIFIENLGLRELTDAKRGFSQYVCDIVDRFIWRTYAPNGEGGLFPLRHPKHDQRQVEIWYQFCEYLIDQEL